MESSVEFWKGKGHLLVFDDNSSDKTYAHSLKTIKKMDEVVEFVRACKANTNCLRTRRRMVVNLAY